MTDVPEGEYETKEANQVEKATERGLSEHDATR